MSTRLDLVADQFPVLRDGIRRGLYARTRHADRAGNPVSARDDASRRRGAGRAGRGSGRAHPHPARHTGRGRLVPQGRPCRPLGHGLKTGPEQDSDELRSGKEVAGVLFEAGRGAAGMLELVEEVLDEVVLVVKELAIAESSLPRKRDAFFNWQGSVQPRSRTAVRCDTVLVIAQGKRQRATKGRGVQCLLRRRPQRAGARHVQEPPTKDSVAAGGAEIDDAPGQAIDQIGAPEPGIGAARDRGADEGCREGGAAEQALAPAAVVDDKPARRGGESRYGPRSARL